jgi:glycosyltransferase involved in cell wall biosynthesis
MRGAALTLAGELSRLEEWVPDIVLVSGMCDVGHFRTMARRRIGSAPVATYFHETQLTYPTRSDSSDNNSFAITNWLSACASDLVIFNSEHHRDTFFGSLSELLVRMPEPRHDSFVDEVIERSLVLPVGVDLSWVGDQSSRGTIPRVLWNHRWEYDKGPEVFASCIEDLIEQDYEFEVVLLGWRPPGDNPSLARIRKSANGRIIHDGYARQRRYSELLRSSDVVVSTSRQENFGVAVVEAIAAGCRPVLPNRLAYPELIPLRYHADVLYRDGELMQALSASIHSPPVLDGLSGLMQQFSWSNVAPTYDSVLSGLAGSW